MEQLTFEDIVGNMDYTAHSTAAKFLSNHSVTPTYAVEFLIGIKAEVTLV